MLRDGQVVDEQARVLEAYTRLPRQVGPCVLDSKAGLACSRRFSKLLVKLRKTTNARQMARIRAAAVWLPQSIRSCADTNPHSLVFCTEAGHAILETCNGARCRWKNLVRKSKRSRKSHSGGDDERSCIGGGSSPQPDFDPRCLCKQRQRQRQQRSVHTRKWPS